LGKKNYSKKINIKIRNYFRGLSFEEGITTLDDDKLTELLFLFDAPIHKALDREEIIRHLRRTWSQSNLEVRNQVVTFLTNPNKSQEKRDRVSTLLSLIEGIERTPHEENMLLEAFIENKSSKVSREKMVAKLNHLRIKGNIKKLEKTLGVTFNVLNEMEFTHSYLFSLEMIEFQKKLLTRTEAIDLDLSAVEEEELIKGLKALKNYAIEKKQTYIYDFLAKLPHEHKYLDMIIIKKALKQMPIECDIYHAPLPFDLVEAIVTNINRTYYFMETTDHFIIERPYKIEFYGEKIYYNSSVSYEKSTLYKLIWKGSKLPIKEEILRTNEKLISDFNIAIEELQLELRELARDLNIKQTVYEKFIVRYVVPHVDTSRTLKVKDKVKRRVLFHFSEYIKPLFTKQKQEKLLAKSIRDFKTLFPLARSLKRKIVFHVGDTNSGKTYAALTNLKTATTGYYLAPLRLLALEGYERLKELGVPTSLITGEEEIIDESSTHISSTIEMMNSSVEVDLCVIDEIQMIADRDRGWAWANALMGVPAKKIILTGSSDALKAIKALCEYLEEPLEVVSFERKNALEVLGTPTPLQKVEPKSAIVTFSRKEVLALKQQLSEEHSVSVVYGNLSPEIRREEARRFRVGESDILIATDAIAMGLNLPIKTLLFATDNKFDGLCRRELNPSEVKQIAGRAGRYGLEEKGYIGALHGSTLNTVHALLDAPLPNIKLPLSVMASVEHVLLIGEILDTKSISEILTFFADNMKFDGPFIAANIDSMLELATIVDEYNLDLKSRFTLACAPASISSPYIENMFHRYIKHIELTQPVPYSAPKHLPDYAQTNEVLLNAEDRVREISLYLWLSFKFPYLFLDTQKALKARDKLNKFIEHSLRLGHFTKNCKRCNKVLDFSYRFSICDTCYNESKRGKHHHFGSKKR
jgi:ATP-dependent RNA helicase SUPV3L1/SUV3